MNDLILIAIKIRDEIIYYNRGQLFQQLLDDHFL